MQAPSIVVAEGPATDDRSSGPVLSNRAAIANALHLLDIKRRELAAMASRLNDQQAVLVELLEADHNGQFVIPADGLYPRRIFTVVRAETTHEDRDEDLVLQIAKRRRMFKRFTKTTVDWTAVRHAIDSGVFPELMNAIRVSKHPKKPYIKIS